MINISEIELSELQFEFQRIDDELDELCELLDLKNSHFSEELTEEQQIVDNTLSEYDD